MKNQKLSSAEVVGLLDQVGRWKQEKREEQLKEREEPLLVTSELSLS